ncbi:hypothetical protein ACNF42_08050 [Cuniculiplasma sp. SKW3]|uniref:hypothetical protein n=1 Tax=Cuniculiplasma sp. SKW4 TaxID=3400171 RepID=UPI003FCF392B
MDCDLEDRKNIRNFGMNQVGMRTSKFTPTKIWVLPAMVTQIAEMEFPHIAEGGCHRYPIYETLVMINDFFKFPAMKSI